VAWTLSEIAGRSAASILFIDSLAGWAACDEGFPGRTTDGGTNWTLTRPSSSQNGLTSVFFLDSLNGWISDNHGGIMHSTDGGSTWSVQRSDSSGYAPLNSIFFLDKNEGWAVGNGIILHTTNGGVSAVNQPPSRPSSFRLTQNYPNPFNPSTTISYQLSAVSYVTLNVYDILGRQVATLADGKQTAGIHTVTWNARDFPSGVYFYRLTVRGLEPLTSSSLKGTFVETRQMVLIK
jgi:Secretion system C-terminal sorting domain/Photosynthesis system II assembly factor YCF48